MTVNDDESDDSNEFTVEDYYRILSTRKEERFLKTRKIREAEEAARRSRITKAIIRVRFPDNCTLEVKFHPSETLQSLIDLLMKVIARPDLPFYIYTTPPKKRMVDMSQDFYSAGFVPGAIVYFSYDLQKGDNAAETSAPFLRDEIMCLKGLDVLLEQVESVQSAVETAVVEPSPVVQERKAVEKKPVKPKWLKM
ncbi:plant UBX domain-containing protein 1-like [Macadamia integrifolia]|uniref:plant UBX domain-containing protein 1-like n=1 Tax=Macadamia integrifolia TaxID=60698 RepID=UPI001C4F086D|nr:plant UBX domain-containing protein 1-like [Macadamia integrifolia]